MLPLLLLAGCLDWSEEYMKRDGQGSLDTRLDLPAKDRGPAPDLKGKDQAPKPDLPKVKPDLPQVKPDLPQVKPDLPPVKPDLPPVKPDLPPVKPDLPQIKPDLPQIKPDLLPVKPDLPPVKPDLPLVKPDTLAPLMPNGASCSVPGDCISGRCADGVCCDLPCTSTCMTCAAPASKGRCVPVAPGVGPPPGKLCPTAPAATCKHDGTCDGAGLCREWPGGTICKTAKCTDSTKVLLADACDGKGTCLPLDKAGATIDCGEYLCDASTKACYGSCTKSNQCKPGKTCSAGMCNGKLLSPGWPCTVKTQCESDKCVDGVCCESDCKDPCETCALPGAMGKCIKVPWGLMPPKGKTCVVAGAACAADGACDGAGKCRLLTPKGTPCNTSVCLKAGASFEMRAYTCNGVGACIPSSTPCGNYVCQPGNLSCYGRCASNIHCRGGLTCQGRVCKP